MSVVALEQSPDAFILGNQLLHARFFTAIELVAKIAIEAPHSVSTAALSDTVGQSLRVVRALLQQLCKSALVCQDAKDAWFCSGSLDGITLADIFRCVSSPNGGSVVLPKRKCDIPLAVSSRTRSQQSVDLLLMQATMAVNQVVLQHLQQFDLGRLRVLASPTSCRTLYSRLPSYSIESH